MHLAPFPRSHLKFRVDTQQRVDGDSGATLRTGVLSLHHGATIGHGAQSYLHSGFVFLGGGSQLV